ncbi:MAG: hypothetical protein MZW92_33740 [Comamonadaceae bacterium]|nr:hypothetical protein [Comamonadaceae bacterium]
MGIPVAFIHPSIVTQYDGKLDLGNTILICVSQSGEAYDIRKVMEKTAIPGRRDGRHHQQCGKSLGAGAQFSLCMDVEKEWSMAATKTFTAEMLILGMLVKALERPEGILPAKLDHLPRLIADVLAMKPQIDALADRWTNVHEAFVLCPRHPSLRDARDLLQTAGDPLPERQQLPRHPTSCTVRFAMVTANTCISSFPLSMNGEANADTVEMISAIRAVGAQPLLSTDDPELAGMVEHHPLLPTSDMFLSPFASAVAGQLFACVLAGKRGIDPDRSRNIKKVTITK